MKSFIASLRSLVLPWGRTSGRRIILDGENGEIGVYNADDERVGRLTSLEPPGLEIGAAGEAQVSITAGGNIGRVVFASNQPEEDESAELLSAVFNDGTPTEQVTLQMEGPTISGHSEQATLFLSSQSVDGTARANVQVGVSSGNTVFYVDDNVGALFANFTARITADGRIATNPAASASSALIISAAAGHTGNLLRLVRDSVGRFNVDADGALTQYAGNTYETYTPTISGGGTATLATADGWYQRLGDMWLVYVYFIVGTAGSGASNVQINLPITPWRGSADRRQNLPGVVRDGGYADPGPVAGIIFAGGAGATVNRIVNSAGSDVIGSDLTAGSIWCFQGWIREQ